jgi:hypothetical protein
MITIKVQSAMRFAYGVYLGSQQQLPLRYSTGVQGSNGGRPALRVMTASADAGKGYCGELLYIITIIRPTR